MSASSQSTQTVVSSPMAYAVEFAMVEPLQGKKLTEGEKMDEMWRNLLSAQTNYCLRLMAHVQPSRSASEYVKSSVVSHLGDLNKAYEGFREICVNLRQALFTVPPLFADVQYQLTDIQLRNHQARKKRQHLEEINTEWLKYLDGEIPQSKNKSKCSPNLVNGEDSSTQQANWRKRSTPIAKESSKPPKATKRPRAPRKPKETPQQHVQQPEESMGAVYDELFADFQAAQNTMHLQHQQPQLQALQQPQQQPPQQLIGIEDNSVANLFNGRWLSACQQRFFLQSLVPSDLRTRLYQLRKFDSTELLTHDRDHLVTYRVQSLQHGWHLNSAGLPQCAAETALLTFLQDSLLNAFEVGHPVPTSIVLWTKGRDMQSHFTMLALALAPLPVPVLVRNLEDLDCPPARSLTELKP
ncbi:hypothetical protein ACROYT_G014462 [Oculina patagonica]